MNRSHRAQVLSTYTASLAVLATLALIAAPPEVRAQAESTTEPSSSGGTGLEEIIVTANKREEQSQSVGMSINALSAGSFEKLGVTTAEDLGKAVPGFTYVEAARGGPNYFLRGMGFDDSALTSVPAVATYLDQVPMSNPNMTRNVLFDLERVEALKGPQGILFGSNSTGGAVNFIAAKPTHEFSSGVDVRYGRFNEVDVQGYVSGSVTDTLSVRLSGMSQTSGPWQHSYTREDSLGRKRIQAGRIIADWEATPDLSVAFTLQSWQDKSDTQAGQLLEVHPSIPATIPPAYDSWPRAPQNAQAADWANPATCERQPGPGYGAAPCQGTYPLQRDDHFVQPSIRLDYALTSALTLTSLSSFSYYNQAYMIDTGASALEALDFYEKSQIKDFNQEFRLAGHTDRLEWVVGANYENQIVQDNFYIYLPYSSIPAGFFGLYQVVIRTDQNSDDEAGFGNIAWKATDTVKVNLGTRYTRDARSANNCNGDVGDGSDARAYNILYGLINASPVEQIPVGGCIISRSGIPIYPDVVHNSLTQHNISYRAGLDWKATEHLLVYVNDTRGFKAGAITNVNATDASQIKVVPQEEVNAYEIGVKSTSFDNRLRVNAAAFYYDYKDKQLRGRIEDPFHHFGILETLLSIPKSKVEGGELQLSVVPLPGLTLSVNPSYTKTEVTSDVFAYDPVGNLINYRGLPFPHTPPWHLVGLTSYYVPLTSQLTGFVNASAQYENATEGLFNIPSIVGQTEASSVLRPGQLINPNIFKVPSYATFDGNLGVQSSDDKWKISIWGKNLLNRYYINNVTQNLDDIYAIAARPRTFGLEGSYKF